MSAVQEVVVTGLGATTPLGGNVASTWEAMLAGRSGVRRIDDEAHEWITRHDLPVKIAAPLAVEPTEVIPRVKARRLDRVEQVALVAAKEAWEHAGLGEPGEQVDPTRLAVVIGTGVGGVITLLDQDDLLETGGLRKVSPLTVPMLMPNGPAAWVGIEYGAQGAVHAPVSACASGAEALAWALRLLRANEVDVVIAGGAEACITGLTVAGFAQARTLSLRNDEPERASRPFDVDRDGFVLGEGSGIMVLERAEFAAARGATVHGRIAGAGITADAYHITGPEPEGRGQSRAITAAIRMAGLDPSDVGHVNCHATSTVAGDVGETRAVRKALGDHPVLTAPKSQLGHMVGAAGAVESIVTLLSIRDGIIPATLNLEKLDPGIELDVVAGEPRKVDLQAAVCDSFGFGGHNAAVAFTKV
ncbi:MULTISPECIES: beta-ketoacyl-[acyl-carrier-protein] synthase family protein [unclassified Pseudonocardia]|uniref:beta-ketoacyl-[acyl-carrier-protein] synthase family protein n=1 Tax=unclassified Pseudonocardia TaxID=2619320 RepID=UPI00096A1816|nr:MULTISPECIES: beta-ketoacyl-[acyl-carrier-protein] synthase family protein [unclassified Pseudonocardia]MBN9099414.1 beta-ketoacyl-[acyl-carrier-protein] synthase family protein [Pseudonocardia sp.]OJY48601.1 MAG: beta-ketoacyl-[acyl-carrier-protein] synthase II [Pseudonocardia sp. 73-21]